MKTYYINLDRSTARRDWMESQLSELQLDYERIPGVDGTHLSRLELKTWTNRKRMFWYSDRPFPPTMVGCYLSHRKAWERAATGSDEFVLIMEDDIFISRKGVPLLKDTTWIPSQTAFIRLDQQNKVNLIRRHSDVGLEKNRVFELFEFEWGHGAGAYIIHKAMAQWLLLNLKAMYQGVDMQMIDRNLFLNPKDVPVFNGTPLSLRAQICPALIAHQNSRRQFLPEEAEDSVINPQTRITPAYELTTRKKIFRELSRFVNLQHLKRQSIKLLMAGNLIRVGFNWVRGLYLARKWEQVPFLE